MARNILKSIMGKYIISDKQTLMLLDKIKEKSNEMYKALKFEDLNEFSKLINEHWELSKKLDKGCSNTIIEEIFECCQDLIIGKMICGAGGRRFFTSNIERECN